MLLLLKPGAYILWNISNTPNPHILCRNKIQAALVRSSQTIVSCSRGANAAAPHRSVRQGDLLHLYFCRTAQAANVARS